MGYYTHYSGKLTISPPITSGERDRLCKLVGITNPNNNDVFHPSETPTTTDLALRGTLVEDSLWGFTLQPDYLIALEDIKGYHVNDGLIFAHKWLQVHGHTLQGTISWHGESSDDSGIIYVDSEHGVEVVADVRDNPGPSWQKVKV